MRVETLSSAAARERVLDRQAAHLALALAVGQVQRTLGPDTATSAPLPGNADSELLAEAHPAGAAAPEPLTSASLAGPGATGTFRLSPPETADGRRVAVPLAQLPIGAEIAWWVDDLGTKASLALPDRTAEAAPDESAARELRQLQARRPGVEAILPDWDPDDFSVADLDRVATTDEIGFLSGINPL